MTAAIIESLRPVASWLRVSYHTTWTTNKKLPGLMFLSLSLSFSLSFSNQYLASECMDYKLFAQVFVLTLVFCFWDHCSRSSLSRPLLKLLQSLCWTPCCILNALLAGGTHQIFVSFPVKQHSAYTGCPRVPSWKVALRWMDAADICSDRKSLMKVNNPSGGEDEEKPEWTFKMMNVCSRRT